MGVSLRADGRRAEPLSRPAAVASCRSALLAGVCRRLVAVRLCARAADARWPAQRATIDVATLRPAASDRGVQRRARRRGARLQRDAGRLERSVGEMRQFSTALAHELRTPLAALRGEIELALRRARDDAICSRRSRARSRRSIS